MRGSTPKLVNNNNSPNHENLLTMHRTVTIVTPQRSNSLDYLNFEEKRQLIASSLSLSEILQCGPAAAAAHAAKEIAETAVIGKFEKRKKKQNWNQVLDTVWDSLSIERLEIGKLTGSTISNSYECRGKGEWEGGEGIGWGCAVSDYLFPYIFCNGHNNTVVCAPNTNQHKKRAT